jgi:5-deoxy-glucuronate isomerase
MMHKERGIADRFEVLCSIPNLVVKRYRLRSTKELSNLGTGDSEALLIPIVGSVQLAIESGVNPFVLGERDACYLPPNSTFSVKTSRPADLIWAQAPAQHTYPAYVKKFSDLKPIESGGPSYRRKVFTAIGEKDPANRFIAGFVEGESGNWTSFPPHKHDGKPEVYIYYGMGRKFGIQVVADSEERAFVVRDGDAIVFERGYHPNVAAPTVGMNFIWIISADPKDRNLSVDFHPDYKDVPVGQTHLSTR